MTNEEAQKLRIGVDIRIVKYDQTQYEYGCIHDIKDYVGKCYPVEDMGSNKEFVVVALSPTLLHSFSVRDIEFAKIPQSISARSTEEGETSVFVFNPNDIIRGY